MARFKRLTDAEARSLTRAELLDRIETEQAYWLRKQIRTDEDQAAWREFSRILLAHVDPAAAIQAAVDVLKGRGSDYWESMPGDGIRPAETEAHGEQ